MPCLSIFFYTERERERMLFHIHKMDTRNDSLCDDGDEDYIDLELSNSPQSREFEFQNSTAANDTETTTSPADELFYKGRLLPLYLPPRRRMVEIENLLLHHPTIASTTTTPSESCRVSCELNPDDYFFEWSNELNTFISNQSTKATWQNKLKLIKHSILAHKLKASRAFLKKFFVKSACSNHSAANPTTTVTANPTIATILNEENAQRRSFSSAIKRHSPTKCLSSSSSNSNSSSGSSSFSLNSNGLHELHYLKRRSSSATEIECSIEGAIAHCKKSQSRIADHCRI